MISIIIPCYNDAQYIEQSVLSALNQRYPYKEVIIVDDGSNAETKNVLKKLEPQITTLITQENQGQSRARNVGISHAKGEYILVLDSDDFFDPTFVEKAVAVFLNIKETKLVTCQTNLIFEHSPSYLYVPKGGTIQDFMCSNNALGSSLFKKEDWAICGGYDEKMRQGFEDWEFFIRLLKDGGTAHVIQEPLYYYRKRDHSTTSKANKVKYELLRYIYNKHQKLIVLNIDTVINGLIESIKQKETQIIKSKESIEFRIGFSILKPLRLFKSFFK